MYGSHNSLRTRYITGSHVYFLSSFFSSSSKRTIVISRAHIEIYVFIYYLLYFSCHHFTSCRVEVIFLQSFLSRSTESPAQLGTVCAFSSYGKSCLLIWNDVKKKKKANNNNSIKKNLVRKIPSHPQYSHGSWRWWWYLVGYIDVAKRYTRTPFFYRNSRKVLLEW